MAIVFIAVPLVWPDKDRTTTASAKPLHALRDKYCPVLYANALTGKNGIQTDVQMPALMIEHGSQIEKHLREVTV
jgi:hypothetical protein